MIRSAHGSVHGSGPSLDVMQSTAPGNTACSRVRDARRGFVASVCCVAVWLLLALAPKPASSDVAIEDLVANGTFDADRIDWKPDAVGVFDPAFDWQDMPDSGSLRIDNASEAPNAGMGPAQCIAIRPGAAYDLVLSIRVPANQVEGQARASLTWWGDDRCLTSYLGALSTPAAMQTGAFESVALLERSAPPGARFAKLTLVSFKYQPGDLFQAWFDGVELVPEPGGTAMGAAALLALTALARRPTNP